MSRRYGRYSVEVSNPDKVLFPGDGLTKTDLIDYYEAVADTMLPHLRDRPLVLQRFPDGIGAEGFYQKQAGEHFPDWIATVRVRKEGGHQDLCLASNAATLAYLANQACVTLHAWLSRTQSLHAPDQLVFDLDPSGRDFERVRRAAFQLRELLEEVGLVPFAKLTGSRGLHVVCPLDAKEDFDRARAFARGLAAELARRHPRELTVEQRKDRRQGRLYLDVGRNAYAQTAVAPYAVRALPGAPVAAPLDWDELADRSVGPRSYGVSNLLRRLGQRADPWHAMGRRARGLTAAREALAELVGRTEE